MRICPNDKFIEIFAQRFHYFEDPFYQFFALNLLFQDTSYSLALKYSTFLRSFSVLHFVILISGSKSIKFAQKFRIFLKFFTVEGTLTLPTSLRAIYLNLIIFLGCLFNMGSNTRKNYDERIWKNK